MRHSAKLFKTRTVDGWGFGLVCRSVLVARVNECNTRPAERVLSPKLYNDDLISKTNTKHGHEIVCSVALWASLFLR